MATPLYVEARIRADIEELWAATQDPARHQRWDLRFTQIEYLDSADGGHGADGGDRGPQRFRYGVRVLGFMLSGTGVCAGERRRSDGSRTSALRFASPHPLSLLAEGSGYWRYVPTDDGIRFLTGYDYRPRWGRFGRLADRVLFRPLMGWATAWSFDRLRLWLERGTTPERSLLYALANVAIRAAAVSAAAMLTPSATALSPVTLSPVTLLVAAAMVLLPPPAATPAARRCLRRRPAHATAPGLLERLVPLT
ncbi:SRPBCC family protein [Actinospica sp.]|jgi:hypothetical protein|uniref:SRPBCC family protein n=1 Tax=Actinospica sp. TaxID=1872142 RepID=UPI002BDBC9C6|nr:SRPBCC family protein [Actinospica sp.]HWG24149.1 SRPBCC family protein [Actinospica sp.]